MNVRQESLYRWQELYFPLPDVVLLSESDGTVQLHHLPAYHRDKWYHPGGRLMDEMSDEARRVTCEINNSYHSQEELRAFMSRLTGKPVDETFKMFPPFYTDFGKNITIGRRVFINAGCHFQDHGGVTLGDGCLIGHNVVFATLNHGTAPEDRGAMYPAPIRLGKNVWVGSNSTILRGVTVGDNAIIAAGSVVTKDVAANTVVGGVPARHIRDIDRNEK